MYNKSWWAQINRNSLDSMYVNMIMWYIMTFKRNEKIPRQKNIAKTFIEDKHLIQ